MEPLRADICVIGAGSGGLSVAAAAAQLGRRVVLVEKGAMGGDCLNTGCVPSKALIAAAMRAQAMRGAGVFGIEAVEPRIDGAAVHDFVRETIATIAPHDSVERFTKLGVTVIAAHARFLDPRTIAAGKSIVRARWFVVATGSRAAVPRIPGLDGISFFTNETIFDADFIPRHLLVVGGGPVGLELAQAYHRLGAAVTVVEAERLLPREDAEMASIIRGALAREGVRIMERTRVGSVSGSDSGVRMQLVTPRGGDVLEGSHLLVATGRNPNFEDLDLEKAGIACSARGIAVDRRLRTTNERVYAIGDVTGAPRFTHVANEHAGLVVRNALFRLPVHADHSLIPRVTFTDPELAHVGLDEEQARARHARVRVARAEMREVDRAVTDRQCDGGVKIVVGRGGRVLGASIMGVHAGELILPWVMAVKFRWRLSAMAQLVAPYPTLGEISRRVAGAYYATALFGQSSRALVRVLSWF